MRWAAKREAEDALWTTDDPSCECAYFPEANRLVVINNTGEARTANVTTPHGVLRCELPPGGMA
ncbi:MAG: hypothetical protein LLF96_05515 [Eubacteriales bacterium]|nr:hypothetical protein [Eubacteriales bacterium]